MLAEDGSSKRDPGARPQLQRRSLFLRLDCSAAAIGADLARREFSSPLGEGKKGAPPESVCGCTDELVEAINSYARAANASPEKSGREELVKPLRAFFFRAAHNLATLVPHSFRCPSCTTINNPGSKECSGCGNLRSPLTTEEENFVSVFTFPHSVLTCSIPPMADSALADVMREAVQRAMESFCDPEVPEALRSLRRTMNSFLVFIVANPPAPDVIAELKKAQEGYAQAIKTLTRHVSQVSCRSCGTFQPNLFDSCSLCGVDLDRHGRRPLAGADYLIIKNVRDIRYLYQTLLRDAATLLPQAAAARIGSLCERNRTGMSGSDIIVEIGAENTK